MPRVSRKEYDSIKRKILRFEEGNDDSIVVIPCDGDGTWFEIGDVSGLLYKYEVCDKIGAFVTFGDDGDRFYNQFKYGRVRLQSIDQVRRRIKQAELYGSERQDGLCTIFQLNKKYEKAAIDDLIVVEQKRQEEVNQVIKIKLADPVLMQKLMLLTQQLHDACQNKMNSIERMTNGARMVQFCDQIIILYYGLSAGEDRTLEEIFNMWQRMRSGLGRLRVELQVVMGIKTWKRKKCMALGSLMADIDGMLMSHMRKVWQQCAKAQRNNIIKQGGKQNATTKTNETRNAPAKASGATPKNETATQPGQTAQKSGDAKIDPTKTTTTS